MLIFCMVRDIISKSQPRQGRTFGGVAHLGERLNGIQEVVGSIPIVSTKKKRQDHPVLSFLVLETEGRTPGHERLENSPVDCL